MNLRPFGPLPMPRTERRYPNGRQSFEYAAELHSSAMLCQVERHPLRLASRLSYMSMVKQRFIRRCLLGPVVFLALMCTALEATALDGPEGGVRPVELRFADCQDWSPSGHVQSRRDSRFASEARVVNALHILVDV